jgi:ABC-type glycerol-3-phosphate transport system substrate-binding protein
MPWMRLLPRKSFFMEENIVKTTFTRTLALLLALLMAFAAFAMVSCADDTTPEEGDDQPGTTTPDDEKVPEDEEEPRIPLDYLPTTRYDGTEIHILEWNVADQQVGMSWVPWEEIDVDVGDGDPLNNAIYDRNGVVEETYGVTITKEYVSIDKGFETTYRANETSGDQAFQMMTCRTTTITKLVLDGLLQDMHSIENLHTDMPWWNQDSVRSYSLGNALFCAAPEMLLRDKGATAAMFYNRKIAADHGIDDLYELAQNGEWTWDYMIEYSEKVTTDMDGDDAANSYEDMFGLWGNGRDMPYHLFAAAGMKFAEIDEDGYLQLNIQEEECITAWQDILDYIVYTDFHYANATKNSSKKAPDNHDLFVSGGCLFRIDMVKDVMDLRNMESDYGVLPVPKYDEAQEDYASLVWMHHDSVLGIPLSVQNVDIVSTVLEHMSYIAYYDVYPIFYDTIILGKSARDQQSKEMLEKIFATRSFDPGQYWLTGELHGGDGFLTIQEQNKTNISSLWAAIEKKTMTGVEKFNEKVDEVN